MNNIKQTPDFCFSQSRLIIICENVANCIERDLNQFADFNINSEKLEQFRALITDYKSYPQDQSLLAIQSTAVEQKQTIRRILLNEIRLLMIRVGEAFGHGSVIYNSFKTKYMYDLPDVDLYRVASNVVTEANNRMENLMEFGFNENTWERLHNYTQQFGDAIKNVDLRINERIESTEKRTILANQLYAKLNSMCKIGRGIWHGISDAHYDNYIIYDSTTMSKTNKNQTEVND